MTSLSMLGTGAKTWCRAKRTWCMKPRWTPILLAKCVLVSSPENVLFVLGVRWNRLSKPSLSRDNHSATRPSFYSLRPFRDTLLRGTCLNYPRQEGGALLIPPTQYLRTMVATMVATGGTRTLDSQLMRLVT